MLHKKYFPDLQKNAIKFCSSGIYSYICIRENYDIMCNRIILSFNSAASAFRFMNENSILGCVSHSPNHSYYVMIDKSIYECLLGGLDRWYEIVSIVENLQVNLYAAGCNDKWMYND